MKTFTKCFDSCNWYPHKICLNCIPLGFLLALDFTQYVFGRIIFLFKMCDLYNRKVVWLIGTFSLVLCWYNLQFFSSMKICILHHEGHTGYH